MFWIRYLGSERLGQFTYGYSANQWESSNANFGLSEFTTDALYTALHKNEFQLRFSDRVALKKKKTMGFWESHGRTTAEKFLTSFQRFQESNAQVLAKGTVRLARKSKKAFLGLGIEDRVAQGSENNREWHFKQNRHHSSHTCAFQHLASFFFSQCNQEFDPRRVLQSSVPRSGRSLEKGIPTHSSILACEINTGTEDPGRLPSMGPQTISYDWAPEHSQHTHIHVNGFSASLSAHGKMQNLGATEMIYMNV